MAAGAADADITHTHTWYAQFGGHLAKLLYDIPHVATVHSLEPLRPWKEEQLGGGYRLSSFCERTALENADAVIAVSNGTKRDILGVYPAIDPDRVHVIYNGIDTGEYHARPGHRRARAARHRSGQAVGRVRRPDHAPEGRVVPAAGGAPLRPERAARAVRGLGRHAGARRRGRVARERAAGDPRGRVLDRADAAQARGDPDPQPRDRVRVPVDLRAARDRQPRGDGLRGRGRRHRDRRHRRGRRRRRDRLPRADRARRRRHRRAARAGALRVRLRRARQHGARRPGPRRRDGPRRPAPRGRVVRLAGDRRADVKALSEPLRRRLRARPVVPSLGEPQWPTACTA